MLWPRKRKVLSSRLQRPTRRHLAWVATRLEALESRTLLSTVNWINPSGGNWDLAANWSSGSVPGAGDDVVINTASLATVTINTGDTESVKSLTTAANDTLSITGGSLTVAAGSTLSGSLSMTGGSLTASGIGATLLVNGSASIAGGSLFATTGGVLNLPTVSSYSGPSNSGTTIRADNAGSQINLPNLTTLNGALGGSVVDVVVTGGGLVNLSQLPQVTTGSVHFRAYDATSVIDLSALTTFTPTTANAALESHNGATLRIGALTTLDSVAVTIGSNASAAPVAQITSLTNGSITAADGATVTFSGLATFTKDSFYATTGGVLNLPTVSSYSGPSNSGTTIRADNAGSQINLPNLTTLNGALGGSVVDVVVTGGGLVNLSQLPQVTTGSVHFRAYDATSVIDLSALTTFTPTTANAALESHNGATLRIGALTTLDSVAVTIGSNASAAPVAQITSLTNGSITAADGATVTFSGLATFTKDSFYATTGGVLNLPTVSSYSGPSNSGTTIRADNAGSQINLPNLTTLNGALGGSVVDVVVTGGGLVNLSQLPQVTTGSVHFRAYDATSVIDLSALTTFTPTTANAALESHNGATLRIGALTTLDSVAVTIGSNASAAPVAQITSLTNGSITAADGATVTFSGLATFTKDSFYATTGGVLNLPTVSSYSGPSNSGTTIRADNAGSQINLPNLTTLNGALGGSVVDVVVTGGGLVNLSQLPQVTTGSVHFRAYDATSVIDLSALTTFTPTTANAALESHNGATLRIGALTTLDSVAVTIGSNASAAPVAQITSLTNGSITAADGATVTFSGLATFTKDSFYATTGGVLNLPTVSSYSGPSNSGTTIRADNAGSQINLPNLTTLNGALGGSVVDVVVTGGGLVNLSQLPQVTTGSVHFRAYDATSVIDLSALTTFTPTTANAALESHGGASVETPLLAAMSNLSLTLDSGGTVNTVSLSTVATVNINVSGTGENLVFNALTSVQGTSITASAGATVSVPAVTSYTSGVGFTATLEATGSGSALTIAGLASLTVDLNSGSQVQVEALAGGVVNLPGLTHVSGGPLALVSDGAGSVIDVSSLTHFNSDGGTVSATNNGIIQHPAPGTGGALALNSPTQGGISGATPVNDWVFLGRPGQGITVTVVTGSQGFPNSWPPNLDYAQVTLTNAQGTVLASSSNSQTGADVTLAGVTLATLGAYHVRVQAPSAHSAATGDYVITADDVTVHQFALTINQTDHGGLDAASAVDHWAFSAAANTQVQFNLVAAANNATEFDLTGPGGFTAFSDVSTSSSLITLPSSGNYVLTVHNAAGAYAFDLQQTAQADLALGTPFQGSLIGSGQAQLFRIAVTSPAPLRITLTDPNISDHNELYVEAGAPPTRDVFDARSVTAASPNQALVVLARPGTYYVLVYDDLVQAAGAYTIEAQVPPFIVTDMTPTTDGNGFDTTLQFTGGFPVSLQAPASGPGLSGIDDSPAVQFVSAGGGVLPANPIPLHYTGAQDPSGLPIVSATLPAHALPAGSYSVRITDNVGYSVTLPKPLTVVNGGVGALDVTLTVPNPIGYHRSSTIYVQYSNVGTAPLPSPLLVLSAIQKGLEGAFLTLDPSLVTNGFVSDTTPAGYSQAVQFLASGATPGVLQPGESVTVPIYYAGWLHTQWDFSRPPILFSVGEVDTTSTDPLDWATLENNLRPSSIAPDAWNAIYPSLMAQMGSTSGSFVQALDNDAAYLGQLGEATTDVSRLFAFEIRKANSAYASATLAGNLDASMPTPGVALTFQRAYLQPIAGRYQMGTLGRGWTSNWNISVSTDAQGDATVNTNGALRFFARQSDGSFRATPSDHGILTATGGAFQLQELDGAITAFNSDGTLNYVQDRNGNRITATYTSGLLTRLTHSNGAFLTLTYTSGLLTQVQDSAGRTSTYTYDAAGQHLLTYTDKYGQTSYTYVTGQGAPSENALASIGFSDNTHIYFSYDPQGRLIDQHRDNNQEGQTYTYGAAGGITTTDANNNASTVLKDDDGMVAETIDALGHVTQYRFDGQMNLTQVLGPLGTKSVYAYDALGDIIKATDPLGLTASFTYDNQGRMLSYQDVRGNSTQYRYDGSGNLMAITYPDNSQEQFAYDPTGNPIQLVNRRGHATASKYNTAGQVSEVDFADGTTQKYTYDSHGNLVKATDASGDIVLAYTDPQNADLVTRITYPDGKFLAFTYNSVGQRTQSVDQTGFTINYLYDALGRLQQLTDGSSNSIVQYTYDSAGRLVRKNMGNGTRTTYQYDAAGNLLKLINLASDHVTVNSEYDYTYDALGRRASMTTDGATTNYGYDADSQLTSIATTGLSITYTYDAAGNRLTETVNGVTTNYTANNLNEYTAVGGTTYQYDADGNLIQKTDGSGTTTFTYNDQNRLTGISGPGLDSAYTYDALGNRSSETVNGQTTHDLTDPFGLANLASQYDGSGNLMDHFVVGLELTSRVDAGGAAYYDFNGTYDVVGITNNAGNYVNRYSYLPFGQTTTISAALANPFTFVGEWGVSQDVGGVLNMRLRDYDPVTGQFLSNDPYGLNGGSTNLRVYAGNAPTNGIDPNGTHNPFDITEGRLEDTYIVTAADREKLKNAKEGDNFSFPRKCDKVPIQFKYTGKNSEDFHFTDATTARYYVAQKGDPDGASGPESCDCSCQDPPPPPPPEPPAQPGPGGSTVGLTSVDPNSLVGPAGFGTGAFIAAGTLMPYRIDFENDPSATAPAQRVDISNQLDANLDPGTFQFTGIGWGNINLVIPAGSRHVAQTVSMTENDKTLNVAVSAGITNTGLVTVSFQSLDPNTDLPPDILTGFLPPEDGTGCGMGNVAYIVKAKAGLASGSQIHNVAFVTFDQGQTIATDQVNDEDPTQGIDLNKQALNTIDAGAPTSHVTALPATSPPSFTVRWSGADDTGGSGIASFDIFVSDNGGPFTLWQSATTQTSAPYSGVIGHKYGFYSVAHDNVGHTELAPSKADATTKAAIPPPSATPKLSAVTTSGAKLYSFTVTYQGYSPVLASTIGPGDITVTGPKKYSYLAKYVKKSSTKNALKIVATYSIVPPGGSWDRLDSGTYSVKLNAKQIKDTAGRTSLAATIGSFVVNIKKTSRARPTVLASQAPAWPAAVIAAPALVTGPTAVEGLRGLFGARPIEPGDWSDDLP